MAPHDPSSSGGALATIGALNTRCTCRRSSALTPTHLSTVCRVPSAACPHREGAEELDGKPTSVALAASRARLSHPTR